MHVLGISALYHDSAAALLRDGEIVAAAQEERFSRKKHDDRFPARAVRHCLATAGIQAADVDFIAFYEKPLVKFERLVETYVAYAPAGLRSFRQALPRWVGGKLFVPRMIDRELGLKGRRYVFPEHHESHCAGAFFPSPFEEAAVLTMDGVGEWATTTLGVGRGNSVELQQEVRFPHSLGLLYSAFTYQLGFEVNEGEYKVMGLAPYGTPRFQDVILRELVDLRADGSFWLDMRYFEYCQGLTMTSRRFDDLFGVKRREPHEPITDVHMDMAASVQKVVEEVVLRMARHLHARTKLPNLCLSGGVALNCVANGRVLREGPFQNVWVQPASGDAGSALGAALFTHYQLAGKPRVAQATDSQKGSLLGSAYTTDEITRFLESQGAVFRVLAPAEIDRATVDLLERGKVVGWFQGRMEYGPRALGSRSLLGDPRRADMQAVMNLKVKFRESFRPFAPCVLRELAHEWFDVRPNEDSPYMLMVAPVRAEKRIAPNAAEAELRGIDRLKARRSQIPAVTHVDGSARIQTVDAARFPRLEKLLRAFHARTGTPILVNTSFNLGWEPIVESPADAWRTFQSCGIDALVMENVLLLKSDQRAMAEARRPIDGGRDEDDPGLRAVWSCPACAGELRGTGSKAQCAACQRVFVREEGIWRLFHPHEATDGDVTEIVKSFYESNPFPNYDGHETLRSLIDKSRRGIYARLLDEQIGFGTRVLEVGCGTGQLSNFLGIGARSVVGADLCLNSLRLAEGFRQRHDLANVRFVQMNLFRPAFKDAEFDVVLCNGVLHHTSDPEGGFRRIARLVKPGGHIVIGLYNRWGRLALDARRVVFDLTGGRMRWLDSYIRQTPMSRAKQESWFNDQYRHPHESKHTMGEVLRWFDESGFDFVNAVPKTRPWDPFTSQEKLFEPAPRGNALDHGLAQAKMIVTGSREGGFYILIGRRQEAR